MQQEIAGMIAEKYRTATGHHSGTGVSLAELIALREEAHRLNLAPRGKVLATRSGGHLSRFRGRGMEFDESRLYMPGDDPRNMDWRVTARTDKPHVKLYREERERPVWLLVDLGPAMRFGTRIAFKSVVAARAAALLAWAASGKGDRIGGLVFDETRHFERRPAPRTRGLLPLLNALSLPPDPNGSGGYNGFTAAAEHLGRLVRPGSLVFMLSDFADISPENSGWLAKLGAHSETVCVRVSDPVEAIAPPSGQYPVTDGIHRAVLDTTSPAYRHTYERRFREQTDLLASLIRRYRAHLVHLRTSDPVSATLARGLHLHFSRTRRGTVQT